MKYVPFETVEEVESFYCSSVYFNKQEYFVVGAKKTQNGVLRISFLDAETEKEIVKTAEECVKEVVCHKKPFGKKLEDVENEK